ncbi:nucleoporin Nup35 [Diorhabda carinulata]|uniref:nucleoporin Nup35 n=1 Tax=Diorhabda carinulata TaxID=1163345 RepID=UPI0025A0D390|nr:nucleoporin Nup35 [Diorhabda carinulata]
MEPMTLGSAPSSPASPGVSRNFLPNFLMGGDPQINSPNPSISPGRNKTPGNYARVSTNAIDSNNLRQKLFNHTINESSSPLSPYSMVPEKAGPPKLGLFDSLEQKKKGSPVMSSTVGNVNDSIPFNDSILGITEENSNLRMMSYNESMSRTPNINSHISDRIDSHWVTVFGFPPSALTLILSQLANCGPIADKKVPPQGNWVHIKFNHLSEVAKALSLNCKLITNNIMIGVTPYHDKENKENESSIYTSPLRARSLRHSFISPSSQNSVVSPQTLPQKSTGIVTKAMEYVFGW